MTEARRLKASLATDVVCGDFRELSDLRFDEYAASGCAPTRAAPGGASARRRSRCRRDLELDPVQFFARTRLAEIERRHTEALAKHIAPTALAAVRTIMAPVRALLATAAEAGLLRSNPCAGIRLAGRRPGVADELPDTRRAPTEDELPRVIEGRPRTAPVRPLPRPDRCADR